LLEVIYALLSGFIVGAVFSFFDLSIPAPPNLAGLMGIVGIYLGFVVINWLF